MAITRMKIRSRPGRGRPVPAFRLVCHPLPATRPTAHWRACLLAASAALPLAALPAEAETWTIVPSLSLTETWSDNINLAVPDLARSDLVTEITPTLTFSGKGGRASLEGTVSVPVLYYLRTGSYNDNYFPLANVHGKVEAVEKFFFVEGLVSVTQPMLTPFGAQPSGLTNATQNRYTSSVYQVSPYIKGENPGGIQYLLRNDSTWANLNGAPIDTSNSYTSEWTGKLDTPIAPLGWHADLDLVNVKFKDQSSQRTNVARVGPRFAYDPVTRLSAHVGYEDNRYPLSDYSDVVYGVGVEWQPTERSKVVANWEHRFFGSSYLFTFDHRTPLSVWNISASRLISSYPQQFGTLAAGGNVPAMLDQLFLSRISDPALRQQAVSAVIDSRKLPTELTSPVNLYTQQITLNQNLSATAGLLGARNGLFVTLYRYETQPISGSGQILPPLLSFNNDNTQLGANLVWSHSLTPLTTLNLTAFAMRTQANGGPDYVTNQGAARLAITTPISPNMSAFAGIRYQKLRSDFPGITDYTESAAFAGISYLFR
jgi:uncharacterized protein (PEP-CTERM system associated)